jgi:hypothetical protein
MGGAGTAAGCRNANKPITTSPAQAAAAAIIRTALRAFLCRRISPSTRCRTSS